MIILSQEKRREIQQAFNEAATPLRIWLQGELDNPGGMRKPAQFEVNAFASKLPWFKRRGFLKAYEKQQAERRNIFRQDPDTGETFYENTDELVKALRKCLPYLEQK